jgi:uncharacterized cupin superfamily protein
MWNRGRYQDDPMHLSKTSGREMARVAVLLLSGMLLGAMARADNGSAPVYHSSVKNLNWVALPEFGGAQAIIYRSPDNKRIVAAFRESLSQTFTFTFDEFVHVTAGSCKMKIHGGPTLTLVKGDVAYVPEGTTADLDFSPDFEDIGVLTSDHAIDWK